MAVTSQPFVVQGFVVTYLKALVYTYWKPEAQEHRGYFIMNQILLKMGVLGETCNEAMPSVIV